MTDNIPTIQSLVEYATAQLVSTSQKSKPKRGGKKDDKDMAKAQTEDILNSILPPREYTMQKQELWIQSVKSTPATKAEVIQLRTKLDNELQRREARETGICPKREELYAQCFDELIRQITINCAERGLLLVRVRDEIRMTIQAYQTLYESSIAFGMRKALQAKQKKAEMQKKIKDLDNECQTLEKQVLFIVKELEDRIVKTENDEKERQQSEEAQHQETIDQLRKHNRQYKDELEKLLSKKA